MYAENNEKRARRPFVRYQSRLELVNQTQSYDVISVDASVTGEAVVVQQVDFVVNIGGHVFVEVVGRTNINIFQDIFVVVVTTIDDTQVFTFRLQVGYRRTQTEVELVLSNSFEVLCFVCPTQGTYASCVVGLGILSSQVDVVSVVFQTTSVGFSTVAVTQITLTITVQAEVLIISTFGARNSSTDTEAFVIISDLNAPESKQLANQADVLVRLVDEIQLANMLADDSWKSETVLFSVQDLIDEVVPSVLPAIKRKGLQLLINNHLKAHDMRRGDRDALRRILLLLMQYAVTSTQLGKITLEVDQDESSEDRLTFRILDTGEGVSIHEMDNLHFPFINQTQNDRYGKADPLAFWLSDQLARKLGGHLNIKTRDGLGTRYSVHIKMLAAAPEVEEEEERLLDDVCVMVDVTSAEIRNIVTRQLENWGATCITPDERLISQDYDIFLTDNPSNLTASGLLLSDDESGVREIGPGQLCVNFNMSNAMQEAVLQLIEVQLAQEEVTESPLGGDENAQLHASGYYALFVDTVPDDVKRLYTEAATSDFAALAQTAHRLKGVFAMLNLVPGKQLCETLEHLIREKDVPGIEKYISDIDSYVKSLL